MGSSRYRRDSRLAFSKDQPLETPYIGNGAVGGIVPTAETIAIRAAEMALRIVNGDKAHDIPIERAPIVPMFDWRQLRRWGISENALPAGSVIVFKEHSFWELYRWRILGVSGLVLLQTVLIAGLLVQRSRRAKAHLKRRLHRNQYL